VQIFLLWHQLGLRPDPTPIEEVEDRLQDLFAPLFLKKPTSITRKNAAARMVYLELPVQKWAAAVCQEDESTFALTIDYPLDAGLALEKNGLHPGDEEFLPVLCRALRTHGEPILREMSPPFTLVAFDKKKPSVFVQQDGLGHWAISSCLSTATTKFGRSATS